MMGLESSVTWRGTDKVSSNVACAAASLRSMPTGGRADHRGHRGHWDRPARPKLGVRPAAPSHGEPRSGPSPARPWRYTAGGVARAAPGLSRCGLPPPRRGLLEERRDRLVNRQPATGGAGCRLDDAAARRGADAPARLVQTSGRARVFTPPRTPAPT